MKFGVLKSKIEKCLIESYNKNTFKDNIFIFNELVRKNKTCICVHERVCVYVY